jgi:putative DNA primase/helicase
MVKRYGDQIRYTAVWGKWYIWTGTHWAHDEKMMVWHFAQLVCTSVAATIEVQSLARSVASASTRAAVVSLAGQSPKIAATVVQWDADLWILCTPGGVVDLRTGELRPARREDYCTKMTGVAPDQNCATPNWDAHLRKVFASDQELIDYFYRVLGYFLTGDVSDDVLFFLYGIGGSGKTTTITLLLYILADYAAEAPIEMFLEQKFGPSHPTELTILRGARLVVASEPGKGRQFSETRVKKLSGGGKISARGMRQDFFTFEMTHKLMFEGENRPSLTSVDAGWRRRWQMLPFAPRGITEIDKQIDAKLREEAPGILAKMIDGCRAWQKDGLKPPAKVIAATNDYLSKQDRTQEWFEACVVTQADGAGAFTAKLYASYKAFMVAHGEIPNGEKTLVDELENRADEFKIKRVKESFRIGEKVGRGFKGIKEVRFPDSGGIPF